MAAPMTERQRELERRYLANQARKKHAPQLSISDDSHHVTDIIGSWYEERNAGPNSGSNNGHGSGVSNPSGGGGSLDGGGARVGIGMAEGHRPLSYINSPSERESFEARKQRRHGTLIDAQAQQAQAPSQARSSTASSSSPTATGTGSPSRATLPRAHSSEKVVCSSPTASVSSLPSPQALHRMSSLGSESSNANASPTSPPSLSRQSSTDTAVQHFPLNDIDYESSPAAVQQELNNLQAIRRMSMNIDTADPDLPSFSNIPTVAPSKSDNEDDPSQLFWVPARLHPELAPKEFKTFVEDRVDKIRRRSSGEDSLTPETPERAGSGSSLRRKKSMLSHQIDTKGNYQDGAERLERKRSKGLSVEGQATVANLSDLEALVNDPAQLMRRMSLDNARRSQDASMDIGTDGELPDMPILPPVGTLKRSTRTTYRRGSLKKGERVPFSRRAQQRRAESENEDSPSSPTGPSTEDSAEEPPVIGLTRVQTEPIHAQNEQSGSIRHSNRLGSSQSSEDLPAEHDERRTEFYPSSRGEHHRQAEQHQDPDSAANQTSSSQQPKQFHSRIASPGRTTAQLPGYNNTNPLPQIVETLADGSRVPVSNLAQQLPERKSSHEVPRQFQRGGAHMRPVPGREKAASSSLDDLSSYPSPLPGSGNTRTDALTMVPTFDERKAEKKEAPRKSSWKWILGSDDNDKKSKDDQSESSRSKSSKLAKQSADKARLDVLQNSIDGTVPARGRESIVLNREDIKLEDERKKDGKKLAEPKKEKEKDGLLSAIFGGKKKTSDGDLKDKKRKADRGLSPEPAPRILKPDIDYNWTRFSILEERAIYRMAHIKLANPRRALYSQVLLSNFMYSYLAKVQMMHPQIQIPAAQRAAQQRGQKEQEPQQSQQQHSQQPPEYNQYQRWQEQQAREQAAQQPQDGSSRTSFDMIHEGQQRASLDTHDSSSSNHDRHSSEDYGNNSYAYSSQSGPGRTRTNGGNYSVASTHDYLGRSGNQQRWDDDDDREEELWPR
ncbi:hypothetical protein DOTSEDRAFT_68467 [Dothistroma septosporum NZE10]|uniref:Protein Zds1 C-terminal domain-containing protein n=1 Tax=Dothistroma septosporum (strain NZE10 / CBS 128990) TaxID=675120 RepID=N1Q4I2_DOTSN|nr:hypothetical protein DOTSEDRAFT_68467 [Dothistroma septosporum NZE10]